MAHTPNPRRKAAFYDQPGTIHPRAFAATRTRVLVARVVSPHRESRSARSSSKRRWSVRRMRRDATHQKPGSPKLCAGKTQGLSYRFLCPYRPRGHMIGRCRPLKTIAAPRESSSARTPRSVPRWTTNTTPTTRALGNRCKINS